MSRTAEDILNAMKKLLGTEGPIPVTTVGHSVGGALALLDALFLSRQLNQTVKAMTYGMPRVAPGIRLLRTLLMVMFLSLTSTTKRIPFPLFHPCLLVTATLLERYTFKTQTPGFHALVR